jgi:hypothetical protein
LERLGVHPTRLVLETVKEGNLRDRLASTQSVAPLACHNLFE